MEELAVGVIVEGKVTGITKFGAFVSLPGGKSGLVHISEIANTYVNDVHEHLTEGQAVRVKIIGIDDSGKISLSIKKAVEQTTDRRQSGSGTFQRQNGSGTSQRRSGTGSAGSATRSVSKEPQTFEEKLKAFMADSDSKISGIRQYSEHKTKTRRK